MEPRTGGKWTGLVEDGIGCGGNMSTHRTHKLVDLPTLDAVSGLVTLIALGAGECPEAIGRCLMNSRQASSSGELLHLIALMVYFFIALSFSIEST